MTTLSLLPLLTSAAPAPAPPLFGTERVNGPSAPLPRAKPSGAGLGGLTIAPPASPLLLDDLLAATDARNDASE